MRYDEPQRSTEPRDDQRPLLQDFVLLYDRFRRPVHQFFALRSSRSDECLDLVQETFLRAYRGCGSFRGDCLPSTWLLSIARNVWLESQRHRSRLKRCGEEISLDAMLRERGSEVVSARAGALSQCLEKERRRLMAQALLDLPPQMRRCLRLRLVEGLRYREIAVALDISIGTVKSQLAEARNRLRHRLGGGER